MRKYLSIILFISVGLGQDVLTTKKGIEYKGEMIEAGYDEVKFIREELPNPQNVKTEIIQSLILSDGTEIVKNGILIRESFVNEESSNSSIQKEEISNLSIQEVIREAILDAKIDALKWLMLQPLTIFTSSILMFKTYDFMSNNFDVSDESIVIPSIIGGGFLGLSSAFYLYTKLDMKSNLKNIENFKPEYIALYEKTYSEVFEKRTLTYGTISQAGCGAAGCVITLAAATGVVLILSILPSFIVLG